MRFLAFLAFLAAAALMMLKAKQNESDTELSNWQKSGVIVKRFRAEDWPPR